MREPIALTGSSQAILTASTGNAQVECFSARPIYDKIKFQIGDDYYALVQLFVASFDIASNIVSLSPAPLPDLRDLDNRTEQATKIYNNWLNYEKVGIQLLSDDGGGLFRKQGQPIVLQNIPFQLPIQHLRPYLSATQEVLLVGTLGHVNAMTNGVLATGTVLGCNTPKPGSASKPGATTNGESSFDRFSLRPTLLAANWDLTFPNYSAQKISSPRAKLVNVGMQVGNLIIQFGWRIDMEQYNVIAADARTALRIEDVEADDLPTTC